jgi:tRNA dimethylallyltransferase
MVKQVLIVAGPTAGGKSSAALNVAQEFNGVVINADSIQVYRELHILSARPSLEDEASAPHSLYGFLSASERFSAGRWLAVAVPEIKSVWEKRKLPIVTGGTGLYLKSLLDGLSPIPDIPEGFRLESEELFSKLGGEAFKEKLRILDPELGASLPAGDGQRLIRAYEVASATGKSLSYWRKIPGAKPLGNAEFKSIILMPPREELYTKIDTRFDLMLGGGALDEAYLQ